MVPLHRKAISCTRQLNNLSARVGQFSSSMSAFLLIFFEISGIVFPESRSTIIVGGINITIINLLQTPGEACLLCPTGQTIYLLQFDYLLICKVNMYELDTCYC